MKFSNCIYSYHVISKNLKCVIAFVDNIYWMPPDCRVDSPCHITVVFVCCVTQVLQATLELLKIMTKHSLDMFCQDCPSLLALAEALLSGGYGNLADCAIGRKLMTGLVHGNLGDVFWLSRNVAAADNLRRAARELLPAAVAYLPLELRMMLLQAASDAIKGVFKNELSCQSSRQSGNPFDEAPEEAEKRSIALHKLSACTQVLRAILSAGTPCVCSGQPLIDQRAFQLALLIVDTAEVPSYGHLAQQDLAAVAAMRDAQGVMLAACTLQLLGWAATAPQAPRAAGAIASLPRFSPIIK